MKKVILLNGIVISLLIILNSALAANAIDFKSIVQASEKNSIVTLNIKSNPTTGYAWFLADYPHDLIMPLDRKYRAAHSALIGAGGYETWRFKINTKALAVPQIITVTFYYARPWSNENISKKTFTIFVTK